MLEGVFFALYYHTPLCRDTINAVTQHEVEALVSEDNNRDLDAQFRDLVYYGRIPGPRVLWGGCFMALLMFSFGILMFKRKQDDFILYI